MYWQRARVKNCGCRWTEGSLRRPYNTLYFPTRAKAAINIPFETARSSCGYQYGCYRKYMIPKDMKRNAPGLAPGDTSFTETEHNAVQVNLQPGQVQKQTSKLDEVTDPVPVDVHELKKVP